MKIEGSRFGAEGFIGPRAKVLRLKVKSIGFGITGTRFRVADLSRIHADAEVQP